MPRLELVRETEVRRTGRLLQLGSLFDVQPGAGLRVSWSADVPIEDRPWSVGLIVGPSGSGKSSVARELFGPRVVSGFDWPADRCILDGFPEAMTTDDAAGLLCSVGFGSVPEWMRPFHVLSTGQQFRATLARALAEGDGLVCVDEFTSVVDRQVAQVCSASVAKTARRMGRQFVAVTCHYDVEDWLDPDWVFDPSTGAFRWRLLRGRPPITLSVVEARTEAWDHFKAHHYLSADISCSAHCYVAEVDGRPVAFAAIRYQPLSRTPSWLFHRLVTLPEWQGVGVGLALIAAIAEEFQKRTPHRVRFPTRNPGLVRALERSKRWRCVRAMGSTGIKRRTAQDAAARGAAAAARGEVIAVWEWRP